MLGQILGGVAEGLVNSAFNAHQAEKNRDFQERMSNTAHQREVKDLQAAGLNPILSSKYGGSSTPSGATAQAAPSNATGAGIQASLAKSTIALQAAQADAASSAAGLARAQAGDIGTTQLDRVNLLIAQARQAMEGGNLSQEQQAKTRQEISNLEAQKALIQSQTRHSAAQVNREEVETFKHKILNEEVLQKAPGLIKKGKEWFKKNFPVHPGKSNNPGASGRW